MTSRWQFLTSLIDCLLSQSSASARSLRLQAEFSESCITTEGYLPMTFRIATNQKITLHLTATDKAQHQAPVENVEWSLAPMPAAMVDISPAADGMSATITAKGITGYVEGEVRADSRIGEDENILIGQFEIEIVAPEASQLVITADEPIDIAAASDPQPEPAPAPIS